MTTDIYSSDAKQTVDDIVSAVCRHQIMPSALADEVMYEHRTRQQMFASFVLSVISKWAEKYDTQNYDLRNEETCRISSEIVSRMGGDWPSAERLPYI